MRTPTDMDPNTCLAEIRILVTDTLKGGYAIGDEPAFELAEKVEALDRWLTKGGFVPEAWESASKRL